MMVNDREFSANIIPLECVEYAPAVQMLRDSAQILNLVVKRRVILMFTPEPQNARVVLMKDKKSDIFHVVDTLHNGVVGSWQAFRLTNFVKPAKEKVLNAVVAEMVVEAHRKKVASCSQPKEVLNDSLLSNKEIHTIDTPASSEGQEVVSEDPYSDKIEVSKI